jgi:hypothetical protein
MIKFDALVTGRLTEIAAGTPVTIPRGPCELEVHEGGVSLAWTERGQPRSVALPAHRLEEYLDDSAILIIRMVRESERLF